MKTEIIIYGRKEKEPKYMESLLCAADSEIMTEDNINRVKLAAGADGYTHFRIAEFVPGTMLDFSAAVNI